MSGRTCPKCGSNVPPDSRFCWNCGFKLSDTPGHEAALQTGASPDAFPPLNGFSPYTSPAPLPMTKPLSESRILAGQASASPPAELEAVSDACRGGRSLLPLAVVGDVTGGGKADALYPVDADRNGVPDVLEEMRRPLGSQTMPGSLLPESFTSPQRPLEADAFRPVPAPTRPAVRDEVPYSAYPFPAAGHALSEPQQLQPQEVASSPYGFPTAGSFVAEPFHEGGVPAYPACQTSYPSAPRDRLSEEPLPRDPILDRYSQLPSRQLPDPLTGDWYRDASRSSYTGLGATAASPSLGAYGNGYAASTGSGRNGYSPYTNGYANGFSYSGLPNTGDTYSGGAVSYGPPPSRCGACGPEFGGVGSLNPFAFPSIGSFVAEPFAPGAPSLSSRMPPGPIPPPLPSFSGPSLLGGSFNFGGFSLPPPTGSFVADATAHATAHGAACQSGGQSPAAELPSGALGPSPSPAPPNFASKEKAKEQEGRVDPQPAPKAEKTKPAQKTKKRRQARGACC